MFTSAFKALAPVKQFELTARLGAYLSPTKQEEVTSAYPGSGLPVIDPGLPASAEKQTASALGRTSDEVVILPHRGEWPGRENEINSPDPFGVDPTDGPSEDEENLDGEYERWIAA